MEGGAKTHQRRWKIYPESPILQQLRKTVESIQQHAWTHIHATSEPVRDPKRRVQIQKLEQVESSI